MTSRELVQQLKGDNENDAAANQAHHEDFSVHLRIVDRLAVVVVLWFVALAPTDEATLAKRSAVSLPWLPRFADAPGANHARPLPRALA